VREPTQVRAQDLVSVYLPTRNRAAMLPRAVESVLRQDHREFELLIVDDASTDATVEVAARLAAADSRLRVLRHDQPGGAPAARNLALRAATGRYVTGLDDDDEMLPQRISSLLRAFDERYAFVCSGAYIQSSAWRRPIFAVPARITLEDLLYRNVVGPPVLTLAERMREVGYFDETMPAWQDYDLWTRLVEHYGPALRIGEPSYVVHVDTGSERITERGAEGARRFIEKHRSRMQPDQLASQELELFMIERRRMGWRTATALLTPRIWRRTMRYFVTSNLPFLRRLAERYRRWRCRGKAGRPG
jgi:glycosyltransferase involved in cell wall biosynthesis